MEERKKGDLVKSTIKNLLSIERDIETIDQAVHYLQLFLKDYDMDFPSNKDIICLTRMAGALLDKDPDKLTKGFIKDLVSEELLDSDEMTREKKALLKEKADIKKRKRPLNKRDNTVDLSLDRWSSKFNTLSRNLKKKFESKTSFEIIMHKTSCVFKFGTVQSFSYNSLKWNEVNRCLKGNLQFNKAFMYDDAVSIEIVDLIREKLPFIDRRDWGYTWIKGQKVLAIKNIDITHIERVINKTAKIWF